MDSTELLIFVVFGFGLTSCSQTRFYEYHYINQQMTWTDAQRYCREKHTDLVTIKSIDDISKLNRTSSDTSQMWIGLTDDPKSWKGVMGNDSNSWRWSATGEPSETDYQNWNSSEPNYAQGDETCVYVNGNGKWFDEVCSSENYFVCFDGTNAPGQRTYTLVTDQQSWKDAQTYCRTNHTDLATIETVQENTEVMSVKSTHTAWIGLYRVPWRWSDKSNSSFRNWHNGEPSNFNGTQHCVAENADHSWHDYNCNRKFFFCCYKDLGVKKTVNVRVKIQTVADLSDPAINAQILQQLGERFRTLQSDVKLRWVTQPRKQEEDTDEADGNSQHRLFLREQSGHFFADILALVNFKCWIFFALKSEMDSTELLIFVVFGFGLTSCSQTLFYEYHYINQSMTWTDAQRYCREKHTDLVTIESIDDISRLNRPSSDTSPMWIGLNDDPKSWKGVMGNDSNSWRWSATGEPSETDYQNWNSSEPNYAQENETCVYVNGNGKWFDEVCSSEKYFVCFDDTNAPGQRTYTLIPTQLSWKDAQTYCRTNHTDLATIETVQENAEVMSVKSSHNAWIGLYRVPWRWSDKSNSSFRNWKSGQPNNYDGTEHCVVENADHSWHDYDCNRTFFFWCYKDLGVKKTVVRVKIQTVADLSDPAINAQILQQLGERFRTLQSDVKLRWVTQPRKQEEDTDEADGNCS
ncbi:macrophage mannose receptor 1-like [Trachinotus anak]|uniref:macrophage mannose receptor 1-like n=1 Tax=Trachinotus anak TaxID=443729 RepID=UPI0039F1FB9A